MQSTRMFGLILAAAFCLAAVLPARADSIYATITLNTGGLTGSGPFELAFELSDGSGTGDGNNSLTLSNFDFGIGGSGGSVDTNDSQGAYSGSLAGGLMLNDSQVPTVVFAFFTPGSQLSFDLTDTYTSLDSPIPDSFAFALFDNGSQISTDAGDGSDTFIEMNFDSNSPTTFTGTDNSPGDTVGAPTVQLQTPVTVPEPATWWLLATGLAATMFRLRRRRA